MTFAYSFGGFALRSSSALRNLYPIPASARQTVPDIDLFIDEEPGPAPDEILFQWPGRYRLTMGRNGTNWQMGSRFGTFLISPDGRRVRAFSDGSSDSPGFMDVIARRVLPRVAILLGALPLHAAGLSNDARGLLIMGYSGAGKSTLSAAASRLGGLEVLGDDMVVLRQQGGVTTVAPTNTGMALWPDSRTALDMALVDCRAMPAYHEKLLYEPPQRMPASARRLCGIVSLCRSDECVGPILHQLSPSDGFALAGHQLIQFNPGDALTGGLAMLFDRLSSMLRGIPTYQLTYPAKFEHLPQTVRELEALLTR